jgi:hypothetical protein
VILTHVRRKYDRHAMPNKTLHFGGGIENASPRLALNEMLLQSHEGVLRLFPCWPKKQNARFGHAEHFSSARMDAKLWC